MTPVFLLGGDGPLTSGVDASVGYSTFSLLLMPLCIMFYFIYATMP